MNKCTSCDSENIEIKILQNDNNPHHTYIKEICNSCEQSITYDRIKVAKRGVTTYTSAIVHALKTKKQKKVMISATGSRKETQLAVILHIQSIVEPINWNLRRTKQQGVELNVILCLKNLNQE